MKDPARFDGEGGASTGGGTSGGTTNNCPDVPTVIIANNCAKAGCHDAKTATSGVDLQTPGLYARLAAQTDPANSSGGTLIDTANPTNSVIYRVLSASNPPGGGQMPSGLPPLSADDIACILSWIQTPPASSGGDSDAGDSTSADASGE